MTGKSHRLALFGCSVAIGATRSALRGCGSQLLRIDGNFAPSVENRHRPLEGVAGHRIWASS